MRIFMNVVFLFEHHHFLDVRIRTRDQTLERGTAGMSSSMKLHHVPSDTGNLPDQRYIREMPTRIGDHTGFAGEEYLWPGGYHLREDMGHRDQCRFDIFMEM
jgi:hypothetical protein